jgi:hypothetical protein
MIHERIVFSTARDVDWGKDSLIGDAGGSIGPK